MAAETVPYGRVTQKPSPVAEVHILWITAGLGCDGDSVSVTAATQPSIEDVILGAIPGLPKVHLHNPVLAYENGDDFMKFWYMAEKGQLEPFVLVVEGSIPNEKIKKEGYWAGLGTDPKTGQPITTNEWIDRLAPKALAIVACGTCATYGGIHAMQGNPTGAMGLADYLGWDWKSKAGLPIIIGSRNAQAAHEAAKALGHGATGMGNEDAAAAGDIIVLTVPFAAQAASLAGIAPYVRGKIVVDTTVPLMPPKVMVVQLPPEGSAALRAQSILGDGVTVVSAFHNVAAHRLATAQKIACDILVFGNDKAARAEVIELAVHAGLRGLHAGALANAAAAEALTSVLIFLNRAYQVDGAGIQITGTLISG